jgi:branched-chain amino acid transport system substrate-binding protein
MIRNRYIPKRYIKALGLLALSLFFFFFWGCGKHISRVGVMPVAVEDRLYAAAEKLLNAGDYDSALTKYQAYVAQYPNRALADDAIMKMASIYLANGRYQEARDQYQRVLDVYPASSSAADAQVGILATYYHQEDFPALFKRVGSINVSTLPQNARLRLYKILGDAYFSSGHMKQAVDAYALSLSCYPEKERGETTPEMVAAIDKLSSREIEELLEGPDYLPKAYLMYHLGLSSMRAGWDQTAKDAFGKFVLAYPNHEFAGEARRLLQLLEQKTQYDRFSVGCLLPLTGPYSSYGNRALHGIELAFSRFRSSYPEIPIKLLVKDTGAEESQAVQAVRELSDAQVAAIIGPIIMAKPAAEEAQRIGIPIITLSQKDDIAGIGEYVFRHFLTPGTQVNTLVSYLADDLGLKRFAILYPDEKYGTTFMNLFWDSVINHGGKVVGCESYKDEDTDFADPINKLVGLYYEMPDTLKSELLDESRPLPEEVWRLLNPLLFLNDDIDFVPGFTDEMSSEDEPESLGYNIFNMPDELRDELTGEGDYKAEDEDEPKGVVDFDALFIPDSPKNVGPIVSRLAYYDVENVTFAGTNLWHSDELIQEFRRYVQRSILTDGFFVDSNLPLVREFVDTYTSVYGTKPGFIEAVAYDTADILFSVIGRPDVLFRSSIREKLIEESFPQCVTGPTTFLETGEAEKKLYLLQIRGGKFRAVPMTRRTSPLS